MMIRKIIVFAALGFLCGVTKAQDLGQQITGQMELAKENREQLVKALATVPDEQREAMEFLIAWLPTADAQSLSADRLLENVRLAHQVRNRLPWQSKIPTDIFHNHVLPLSCLDEPRTPWRAEFHEQFWPLVETTTSASEAAQILNAKIFEILNVKYSTGRKRSNQCPAESIEQGLASCSGLSIILVDACRAVGVPARIAGIPNWSNKSGNHTWVEIWDGDWHFTGAAEFDEAGLDRGWFRADAALADPENPRHSIFATSYAATGLHFPLAWNHDNQSIPAENVTARYRLQQPSAAEGRVRTMFRALAADGKQRVLCDVTIELAQSEVITKPTNDSVASGDDASPPTAMSPLAGATRDETRDTNEFLEFNLQPNTRYAVTTKTPNRETRQWFFKTSAEPQQMVEWRELPAAKELPIIAVAGTLDVAAIAEFGQNWFAADAAGRKKLSASTLGQSWPGDSLELRRLLWQSMLDSGQLDQLREDLIENKITSGEHVSPFVIKDVGTRPADGWPLVIAMHGGGNAPQELNDSQWRHMQIYYHDHPEISGYRYLALRAPNNTWNGFYDNYVYPLIADLVAQQVAWNDVNPQRVYLIGYSHGGYGAFSIGPKMPDLFAAVHASAAAPSDGESVATGLHSTRFTWMVGERDSAYGRLERCQAFDVAFSQARGTRIDRYPGEFQYRPGFGHGGLPDRDWLVEMLPFTRKNSPREVDWEPTDPVVTEHYWISIPKPVKGQKISARLPNENRIELATIGLDRVSLCLDERLVDPTQPLRVGLNGESLEIHASPTLANLCTSLLNRRDPYRAGSILVDLQISPSTKSTTESDK